MTTPVDSRIAVDIRPDVLERFCDDMEAATDRCDSIGMSGTASILTEAQATIRALLVALTSAQDRIRHLEAEV